MPEFITETIEGSAAADWRAIQQAAGKYSRARIKVEEYTEELMESERQRKWLNGVAIPYLMDKWGHSRMWVKLHLKLCCGEDLFNAEAVKMEGETYYVISGENSLSRKQARTWIENILDYKPCEDAGLEPPDPEWRKKKQPTPLFEHLDET